MSIPARYQVRLKDNTGVVVAVFDDWRSLQYQRKVNSAGYITFIINGDDERAALIETDGQIEVLRAIPGKVAWYTDFDGIMENRFDETSENGNRQLTITGSGLNGLLARRIIAYLSSDTQADKTGVAETVMKQYVNENIGPGATTPPRQLSSGVMAGFAVEANAGAGSAWTGQRASRGLLETLQDIANASGVDFDVVRTGAAAFEFRVYASQLGYDRTTTGLVYATGLNAAGYAPIVFSIELGNIAKAMYSVKRSGMANAVYVYGQGTGALRDVVVAEDAADLAASPYARREMARNGSSQDNTLDLQQLANEYLNQFMPRASFEFTPLFTDATLYGVDFNLGDKITAEYNGVSFNKRITAVTITVSGDGEAPPALEMADIP